MTSAPTVPTALYPLAYAARLVGLSSIIARRWARGYAYVYKGERRQAEAVLHDGPEDGSRAAITFQQLLTLRLVRAFRETGLGLQTIRKAARIAVERYGIAEPFVSKSFRSDGRSVFIDLQRRDDVPGSERLMVDALTGQQQFRNVVEPSLFRDVVFLDQLPLEWFPLGKGHAVVIRPDRAFGAPHIRDSGVRTDVIADAVIAEGGGDGALKATASWFDLPITAVRDAVAAETEWRIPRAA